MVLLALSTGFWEVDGPGAGEGLLAAFATTWARLSFWSFGRGISLGMVGDGCGMVGDGCGMVGMVRPRE
jgi:hypothetical protein